MTTAAEADSPTVICVAAQEFRARTGAAWRQVADGSIVRVSDGRSGAVLGYLVRDCPAELREREDMLPSPAASHDSLGPDERERLDVAA